MAAALILLHSKHVSFDTHRLITLLLFIMLFISFSQFFNDKRNEFDCKTRVYEKKINSLHFSFNLCDILDINRRTTSKLLKRVFK